MTTYTIALELTKEVQRVKRPVCVRINENETQTIKAQLTRYYKPCTVECDKAQLHMLRDDGTWSHVDATCTGDSVECAIKAVQLGKTAQNACAYFFFQKGTQTETTESFQLRVERAAIDTEASDAFFDTTMNAIATKWGAYENAAEAQESARQSAESKRITAEQERAQAEQSRLTAEQKRQQAEQERISAEQARVTAEQKRVSAEQERARAEHVRGVRDYNRSKAENERREAEQSRAQAESARQSNESTRTSAEQSRQSRFNEMLDAAQNVKFRILSASEVDSEGKPTITGSPGIIYLVKAQSAQETKANHYTEWIYLEGRWELFGSTAPTADPIEVDDIDKLANGTTIAGNRVLNATGLSALWCKLQARMQAVSNDVQTAQSTANAAKQASASNASSIQSLSSKQSTFEQQASSQLKALRTWAESTLESKMKERYNAGFNKGKQEGGEEYDDFLRNYTPASLIKMLNKTPDKQALIKNLPPRGLAEAINRDVNAVMSSINLNVAETLLNTAAINDQEKIQIYNNVSSENMLKVIPFCDNAMKIKFSDLLAIVLKRRSEVWVDSMASGWFTTSRATKLCSFLVTHSDVRQRWNNISDLFDLPIQTISDFLTQKIGGFTCGHVAMPLLKTLAANGFVNLYPKNYSLSSYMGGESGDWLILSEDAYTCIEIGTYSSSHISFSKNGTYYGEIALYKRDSDKPVIPRGYDNRPDRTLYANCMLQIKVND